MHVLGVEVEPDTRIVSQDLRVLAGEHAPYAADRFIGTVVALLDELEHGCAETAGRDDERSVRVGSLEHLDVVVVLPAVDAESQELLRPVSAQKRR